jgi:hypothetical protein
MVGLRRLVLAGIAVLLTIVILFSALASIFLFDLSSYGATGHQTLNPAGPVIGRALVVYDPGLSGAAKGAAQTIAGDLQQKGYVVELTGVRSSVASDTSGYNIVVAGGPNYFGQATSSIIGFLKGLGTRPGIKMGVFFTTGNSQVVGDNYQMLQQQVKSATSNPTTVELVLTGSEAQNCADLVATLTS